MADSACGFLLDPGAFMLLAVNVFLIILVHGNCTAPSFGSIRPCGSRTDVILTIGLEDKAL